MGYFVRRSPTFAAVQWKGDNLDEFREVFGVEFTSPPCPLNYWFVQCGHQQPYMEAPEIFERTYEPKITVSETMLRICEQLIADAVRGVEFFKREPRKRKLVPCFILKS